MTERKRKDKPEKPMSTMLTTGEVARIFNVHASTIRRWSQQGIIKSYRLARGVNEDSGGRTWRFSTWTGPSRNI